MYYCSILRTVWKIFKVHFTNCDATFCLLTGLCKLGQNWPFTTYFVDAKCKHEFKWQQNKMAIMYCFSPQVSDGSRPPATYLLFLLIADTKDCRIC